jgi:hypothetical protein
MEKIFNHLPLVLLTKVANLPNVSTALAKLMAKFAAGVLDTGCKFATGVGDTFTVDVIDTGGAP